MTDTGMPEFRNTEYSPTDTEETASAVDAQVRRVGKLYRIGDARWYDTFRAIWKEVAAQAAEAAFDRLVMETGQGKRYVLDIGCGTGYNLGRLQRLDVPFSAYYGIDPTDAMLTTARKRYAHEERATFEDADFRVLAETPQRFDLILCTWVASHLDHPRELFELAQRLLTPSGDALFLFMSRPRWYVYWWFAPLAHLFRARCVYPTAWRDLPGTKTVLSHTAGLATIIHLQGSAALEKGRD